MTALAPAEKIALRVATQQISRGEAPTPNVAAVSIVALDEIAPLLDALDAAIDNPGHRPAYHREILERHRREWPTLWRALDELRARHR